MDKITEPMLAALIRSQRLRVVRLSLQSKRKVADTNTWTISVKFILPRTRAAVERLFEPPADGPERIRPEGWVNALARGAEAGKLTVWAHVVPHRETISPTGGRLKTVADLDRYIKRLRELGARDFSIDINLGAKQ